MKNLCTFFLFSALALLPIISESQNCYLQFVSIKCNTVTWPFSDDVYIRVNISKIWSKNMGPGDVEDLSEISQISIYDQETISVYEDDGGSGDDLIGTFTVYGQGITTLSRYTVNLKVEGDYIITYLLIPAQKTVQPNIPSTPTPSYPVVNKREECYECNGSGFCPTCGRTGRIKCFTHDTNGDGHCTDCNDTGYVPCYKCRGKAVCPSCSGTGYRN